MNTTDAGADEAAGEEETAGAPRGAVVALALRSGASALALVAAVGVVAGRAWFGGRTPWVLGLAAAGVAILWGRGTGRPLGHGAAVPLAIATVVVATGLGRAGPRDERAPLGEFDARVLGLDLAPRIAYVAAVCLVLGVVACLALGAIRWDEPVGHRRTALRAAGAGLAAAVALAGVAVVAGGLVRARVDARADADTMDHAAEVPAERLADAPGPARPAASEAWLTTVTPAGSESPVVVPGWDILLVADESDTEMAAVSKVDGTTLWRYEREGRARAFTVDPEAGRILVVGDEAAVVLDLVDGSEVTTRRIPDVEACRDLGPSVRVSTTALLVCGDHREGDRLVAVDVATATAHGPVDAGSDAASGTLDDAMAECDFASAATGPAVVVRTGEGGCRRPEVWADDGSGRLEALGRVEPPGGADGPWRNAESRLEDRPLVADDLIVVRLTWDSGDAHRGELIALDREGEVRWRIRSEDTRLVALTDDAVVTAGSQHWRLVSREDGAELARDPVAAAEGQHAGELPPVATDGERLYSTAPRYGDADDLHPTETDLVVRRLDDLSLLGTWDGLAPLDTAAVVAANDRLVFATRDGQLVAHGSGDEPPTSTERPPPFPDAEDGGDVRLVDSGFTVVPNPRAARDDREPTHDVSVGAVVENTSGQVAADVTVRLRPIDGRGQPVTIGGPTPEAFEAHIGAVFPGRRAGVGHTFPVNDEWQGQLDAERDVADVAIEVSVAEWWPPGHHDLELAPMEASDARISWTPPDDVYPGVVTATIDSASDEPVEFTVDTIVRDAAGDIIGGWGSEATTGREAIVAPPGRSRAAIDLSGAGEWFPAVARDAAADVEVYVTAVG